MSQSATKVVLENYSSIAYPLPGTSFDIPGLSGDNIISFEIIEIHKDRRTVDILVARSVSV